MKQLTINNNVISLYIHLPFCKKKCNYCDFVSYAGKEDLIDEYVESLCKEIKTAGPQDYQTIYFGGGTPTLLSPKHFDKVLKTLTHLHKTPPPLPEGEGKKENDIEISIETNPGTADKAKLKVLRELGINRLSIGAQSFNNQHLKTLGRIHSAEDIIRFYNDARSAGFENINLDLIFALPGQTLAEWQADIQTALKLKPEHLSVYNLQIEEGTPFHLKRSTLNLPQEDLELAMYEDTIESLTSAGFKHYEISNFSKPGFECKHNLFYWRNGNYLGVGAGAHSHVDGQRWANPNSIENYIHDPRPSPQDQSSPLIFRQETIFMGLRLLDGLEIEKFKGFEQEVADSIGDNLLTKDKDNYKLTRKGLYLANLVFERFV
ncbi:hypothetical protein A2291_00165 [candidate division WOR-1 bacterium RIFOXYB2_FULL_42_35]|uniref:Heme chaperone HemW n=1 Tax=candidate division WOR-1 bacterium RIFOXYC2_FULL_41_25 TaxID=1802586 RepID=A0A1F4TM78_UNCSA|nr:MAG: hypothetical protein A2247_05685 [candidate division WOR-1 bacterium RIFOXYA2_FULL_41_14]OGC24154.1 MAG: hypothetical protein A2291_00165 [candidate division WOR-1 bacterium RIFOXYB2_FULL_42_35]OGC33841.1 MAG: hypothetical protein A2462_01840 [candidate division WOR-1 bacterium RIFOXYC2_FULL_41_25]OGC41824.1 MAG: hypothetical protein A2548_04020 [candidate division WOR-1 bacterium RIFOXYD2_FULL_41_8]